MRTKTLFLLAAATLVVGATAALVIRSRESAVAPLAEQGRFLPGIYERIEDISEIVVRTTDGEVTLTRTADGWGVAEKGGYPAEADPIRKTLIGLAEMRALEPKTAEPERWAKLGVDAPDAEGSSSKLVRIADKSGTALAEVVIGNPRSTGGSGQLYVRRPGEDQAWLVEATLDLKQKPKDWLQREIVKLERDRVQSVSIENAASGETLRVTRPTKADTNFEVLGLAEDQELKYPTVASSMGSALEYLNLEDVMRADEAPAKAKPLSVARFWTFDGLRMTVTIEEEGGRTLARFAAAYDPDGGSFVVGPAPAEGDAGDEEAEALSEERSPAEVQAEVEQLNARLSPWVFAIQAYGRANFVKTMADLVKEPPKPVDDGPELGTDERPVIIPSHLPPEIQEQIKAHQASLGNKTVVKDVEPAPSDEDAATPPEEEPTPPEENATPPEDEGDAEDGPR